MRTNSRELRITIKERKRGPFFRLAYLALLGWTLRRWLRGGRRRLRLGLVCWRWRILQQQIVARQAGHVRRTLDFAQGCVNQTDADAVKGLGGVAVQLHPRFGIGSFSGHYIGLSLGQITLG